MIITIDGTSSSGKSTAGKMLANKLNFCFLSSGEIYRAIAYLIIKDKLNANDVKNCLSVMNKAKISAKVKNNIAQIYIDEVNATPLLHNPEVSVMSAKISPIHEFREFARSLQHKIAEICKDIVVEGRDTGSVVFPNADYKFFVSASLKERTNRRYLEYKSSGKKITKAEVLAALKERDMADQTRHESPLIVPKGAVKINSSNIDANCVTKIMLDHVKKA
ncbi:MAG: (d)CMP kinase [Clostridia bacterium]|nr:(d)CMP kinase [Clostridia bacterium]